MIETGIILLLEKADDHLIVGFGFEFFNQEAPKMLQYNGARFERGMLEVVPQQYASSICSVRRYNLV